MTTRPAWPAMPYEEWLDTKTTLHLFTQIVGKIRLALAPKLNHWWHVPLYLSPRGLTTGLMPFGGAGLDVEFDLVDHRLVVRTTRGTIHTFGLGGTSVAAFYRAIMDVLAAEGVPPTILAKPFDPQRVGSDIPFADDETHATYVPEHAHRFWLVLLHIDDIFKAFRGRFVGKCSPVHFFWHSFDLAVTRFSGRAAPVPDGADPVTREAYTHEVISAGFWPGDDNVREPMFYSYVAPEPPGLAQRPLRPDGARWETEGGGAMALLRYDDLREDPDPRLALLAFLESAYEAGARLADWPLWDLEAR